MDNQCEIGKAYNTVNGESIVIFSKNLSGWYIGIKSDNELNKPRYCLGNIYILNKNGYDVQGNQVIVFKERK